VRYVVGRVRVRPERRVAFIEASRSFVEATRREPECIHFEVAESLTGQDLFIVVECFASASGHAEHLRTAHYLALKPLFDEAVLDADFEDIDSDTVKYTHVGIETH
jgi:quinol monooxygenase YgiN